MKTALDWITDPSIKQRTSESDVVKWIEAIQLDAIRYGMEQAARMCGEAGDSRTGAGRELTDTEMHEASGCYGCQDMLNRAAKTAQLP